MDTVTSPDKHNVPGPYAYPYGKRSEGWSRLGGLQLGKQSPPYEVKETRRL